MGEIEMTDNKAMKRVFGIYRTGWTEPKRANFLERIVRTLWKRGPMTTGALSAYLALRVQDELFQQSLSALKNWNIISVEPRAWGSAYVAKNTEEGNSLVAELVAGNTRLGDGFAMDLV